MTSQRQLDNDDDDDADISVTSTPPSEAQDEYEVEHILSEQDFGGRVMYLVKWAGYTLDRCTWEPQESFCDPETLKDWAAKKEAIAQGKETPFDVDKLCKDIQAIEDATALRKQRRKEKRIRLGLPVSPDHSDEDVEDESSPDSFAAADNDADEEQSRPVPSQKQPQDEIQKGRIATYPGKESEYSHRPAAVDRSQAPAKSGKKNAPGSSKPSSTLHTGPSTTSKKSTQHKPPSTTHNSIASIFPPRQLPTAKKHARPAARNAPSSALPNQKGASEISVFRNLSTQRRHEKAMREDREPDISQLDLRTPSEWLNQSNKPTDASQPLLEPFQSEAGTDSLFVEQDVAELQSGPLLNGSPRDAGDVAEPLSSLIDGGRRNSKTSKSSTNLKSPTVADKPVLPPQNPTKRRQWQPGDVMVHLKFGAQGSTIGDIRICGLNPTTTYQLLNMKSKNQILIDFSDTCTYEEYAELCKTGYNTTYANGWAIGFDDTSLALSDMANHLRENDLAALWYHAEEEAQLVFVAYAAGSPKWSFLDNHISAPPGPGLRVVARGTLPPLNSVRSLGLTAKESQLTELGSLPAKTTNADSLDMDDSSHATPSCPTEAPNAEHSNVDGGSHATFSFQAKKPNGVSVDVDVCDSHTPLQHSPLTPPIPFPPQNNGVPNAEKPDIVGSFRDKYGIAFKELSSVKTKTKVERVRAFFLCFPSEPEPVNNEFKLIQQFLEFHNVKPFSNRQPGDWERFIDTATSGTIIFHQSYISYENLPGLNKKLLLSSFNIFNISLDHPIDGLGGCHFQRLFPSGGVVLMTEDFIIHETSNAIEVLEWFGEYSKVSSEWKVFFRPNIEQWLFNLFDTWPDDKMYQIYCWVKHLIPRYPFSHYNFHRRSDSPDSLDGLTDDEGQHHPFISPRTLPSYGTRSETEHDAIPRGLSQEERNTDHLVEYFGGWALMNCHKYRKFFVLTHFKPQPRWEKWHHLVITNGKEFIKNISNKKHQKSREHGHSRTTSTASSNPPDRRQSFDTAMQPPPLAQPDPPPDPPTSTHHPAQPSSTPGTPVAPPSDMMDLD